MNNNHHLINKIVIAWMKAITCDNDMGQLNVTVT